VRRGEGIKGRVLEIVLIKHPLLSPPPSRGREYVYNPEAELRGIR